MRISDWSSDVCSSDLALVSTWRAGLFLHSLQSLLEAGLDERIKMTVEHLLRVGNFDARAQILDPRLIEHVRADLVAPLDVALGIFDRLLGAVEIGRAHV